VWLGHGLEQRVGLVLHERFVRCQESKICRGLPSLQRHGKEEVMEKIDTKQVHAGEGKEITVYTVLSGKYRIWRDLMGFHRWCLDRWPDDGQGGIITHGKAMSIRGAIDACKENDALRKEIYG